MGEKVELSSVIADFDTWSTTEMLMLRAELVKRIGQSDDLHPVIHSLAKNFALQAIYDLPEMRQMQSEFARIEEENRQHKLELEALKELIQSLKEENDQRNLWLQEYVQRVEQGEAELKQLEKVLPWDVLGKMERPSGIDHLPPDDDWQDIEWVNTHIGVSLFFRNSGNPRTIRV